MTNLKPCPCGKTPTQVVEGSTVGIFAPCCFEWSLPRGSRGVSIEEAWNAAPRAVPIPCPNECDHGRLPDVDAMTTEQFLAAIQNGDELPTIPCPTCAPFGGRGAVMVEERKEDGE